MKTLLTAVLVLIFHVTGFSTEPEATKDKITRDEAQHIALKEVPDGSVKSARLEGKQGSRFWSVEIARPNKTLTDVHVDARSGRIIAPTAPAEGPKR